MLHLCLSVLVMLIGINGAEATTPGLEPASAKASTSRPGIAPATGTESRSAGLSNLPEIPDFQEDRRVYEQDSDEPLELTVTLFEKGGAALEDVDRDTDFRDTHKPFIEVLFQEGAFAQGETSPNAIMKQRGHSSRQSGQKSYQIKLSGKNQRWRNHRIIHLNKHPFDLTRLRNKLAFALFQTIPHLGSMRTRFAHLTIKKTPEDQGRDYGLFTQIEDRSAVFLANHGLDPEGNLYSAEEFLFLRYPRQLLPSSSPNYRKDEFERILEIRGSPDHTNLLTMLDEVNDEAIPIDLVIRRHFNRNNYLSWFAANILLGNLDTVSQNFSLYSPKSGGWYFLPWDYDEALGLSTQPDQAAISRPPPRIREGIANWWGNKLHRRFLSVPANLEALRSRVEELRNSQLSPERIKAAITPLRAVVRPFLARSPDMENLPFIGPSKARGSDAPGCLAAFDAECDRLPEVVETSFSVFQSTLARPMPFRLGEVKSLASLTGGTRKVFQWHPTITLTGDDVTYDFQIATSPRFADLPPVFEAVNLTREQVRGPASTALQIAVPSEGLPTGRLFWRVIARSLRHPSENWQYSSRRYVDSSGEYPGVTVFPNHD